MNRDLFESKYLHEKGKRKKMYNCATLADEIEFQLPHFMQCMKNVTLFIKIKYISLKFISTKFTIIF